MRFMFILHGAAGAAPTPELAEAMHAMAEGEVKAGRMIADFAPDDRIVLNGFSDHSFADAVASHHIAQVGADVAISDDAGVIVTLQNVSLASLQANDFVFG